jgi:hypothetical protein
MNQSNPSRRDFLKTTAIVGGATLAAPVWWSASANAADSRVAQILSQTIAIDMHNHVYPPGTEPHPQRPPQNAAQQSRARQGGPPPAPQQEPTPGPELFLAAELKKSGLTAGSTRSTRNSRRDTFAALSLSKICRPPIRPASQRSSNPSKARISSKATSAASTKSTIAACATFNSSTNATTW